MATITLRVVFTDEKWKIEHSFELSELFMIGASNSLSSLLKEGWRPEEIEIVSVTESQEVQVYPL